ncbi:MAG: type I methionyl aminopeptidase [Candidatus Magasanikbacteria bacterium RIFOXYC2_FULL_39_8]|nr:MAG: type I methionyl aminopeptidase [Candidatus Magasanikbacteria bacterium RIFOXYC2_FULL_39_8]
MSYIKTSEEIKLLIEGGKILGEILEEISHMAVPGATAFDIDARAEKLIKKAGGRPAFKGYRGRKYDPPFPSTICASINEELVHGIATKEKILKDGDIFSIDIGMEYPVRSSKIQETISKKISNYKSSRGYFTDTAITVIVGEVPEKTKQLLNVTKKALEIGIKQCTVGNTVADIGRAIQDYVEPQGYGIVRDLVGHGVGHAVHEDPRVPNFYEKDGEQWELRPGVVIAIEPMISIGDYMVETADDGWSISMKDKSLCAHFEHTIVITEDGPLVITRRPCEIF